uniref:Uncharacterized protein n=1 Tax=Panagrolaimus sp. ES5 TaxID=591445 RepID=A0AC34GUV5_9BILA
MDYIYLNGSSLVKLKLLKSCKQIGAKIQRENFHKFDAIVILSNRFLTELKLVDGKIVCLVNSNFEFENTVTAKHLDIRTTIKSPIISKINHSMIKELRLSHLEGISYESFKKFLTPNLIRLELILTVINDLENAGMIILKEAYNLKFLEIKVTNIPSLKELAKIERSTKLEGVTISCIKLELDVDSIALFIQNQLAPGGNLNLYFAFPQYTKIIGAALDDRPDFSKIFNYKQGVLVINFVKL